MCDTMKEKTSKKYDIDKDWLLARRVYKEPKPWLKKQKVTGRIETTVFDKTAPYHCPYEECKRHALPFNTYEAYKNHFLDKHASKSECNYVRGRQKHYVYESFNLPNKKEMWNKMRENTDEKGRVIYEDKDGRTYDICGWDGCMKAILRKKNGYGEKDVDAIKIHEKSHMKSFDRERAMKGRKLMLSKQQVMWKIHLAERTKKTIEPTSDTDTSKRRKRMMAKRVPGHSSKDKNIYEKKEEKPDRETDQLLMNVLKNYPKFRDAGAELVENERCRFMNLWEKYYKQYCDYERKVSYCINQLGYLPKNAMNPAIDEFRREFGYEPLITNFNQIYPEAVMAFIKRYKRKPHFTSRMNPDYKESEKKEVSAKTIRKTARRSGNVPIYWDFAFLG